MDTALGRVFVGPAGWSYADWKGVVYPANQTEHPLSLLARYFDMVEINSSFYRPPDPRNCEAWLRHTEFNEDFIFAAKLWRGFTHQRGSFPGETEIKTFTDGIAPLLEARKLGALLVQFPWSFRRTKENRLWLGRIVKSFSHYPLAVEFRHNSWNTPVVLESCRTLGVSLCNIDQPLFNDSLPPTEHVTSDIAYVRLHGRNSADWFREDAHRDDRYNYLYSVEDLATWFARIQRMRRGARRVFVVTNNHYEGQAVVNALELQAMLGEERPTPPSSLLDRYPRLQSLADGSLKRGAPFP